MQIKAFCDKFSIEEKRWEETHPSQCNSKFLNSNQINYDSLKPLAIGTTIKCQTIVHQWCKWSLKMKVCKI